MGCTQLIVLTQPQGGNIADLEEAIQRCVEAAPIRFVDGLVLTKDANGAIDFNAVSDIENAGSCMAWSLRAGALRKRRGGKNALDPARSPTDEPGTILELKKVHLLEISDRIPRNSTVCSSLSSIALDG